MFDCFLYNRVLHLKSNKIKAKSPLYRIIGNCGRIIILFMPNKPYILGHMDGKRAPILNKLDLPLNLCHFSLNNAITGKIGSINELILGECSIYCDYMAKIINA